MVIKVGILSDTHTGRPSTDFLRATEQCFGDCEVIIHAGDLTDIAVLSSFIGKKVYGVHGNMCAASSRSHLPAQKTIQIGDFTLGITHGDRLGQQIEIQLIGLFPEADCLIYGHTHRPVCHRRGDVLIINPGTFRSTGRYGAPGTYAILEVGETLKAAIHKVKPLS